MFCTEKIICVQIDGTKFFLVIWYLGPVSITWLGPLKRSKYLTMHTWVVAHLGTEFIVHMAFSFSVLVVERTYGEDFVWDHLKNHNIFFSVRNSLLFSGLSHGNTGTHVFYSADSGSSFSRMVWWATISRDTIEP